MANLTEQETAMKTQFEKNLQLAEQGDAQSQLAVGLSYKFDFLGANKNSAQAIEWLKKAAEQGNAWGQFFLGKDYFDGEIVEQNFAEAFNLLKKSAEQDCGEALPILADCYFEGKGVEKNQPLFWQWFEKTQQQNDSFNKRLIEWLEKKAEEGNADAYIKRADAYYSYFHATHDDSNKKLDLFRKALADYTKAIELNPNEADFYIKRADAYHDSGYELYYYDDYDTLCKSDIFYKALNDYTKAIELNPNCYSAYYARAMFHQRVDYFFICDEQALNAIPDYTKVIELAPDENYAYYNRAQCYQFLKEYNKAIADYSKCLELDDKYNYIYNDRGYCYEELKEYDKAIADYSKAIEMDYPISFPYFRRANCYHNLKKYDEALADYSKGFKLGATSSDFFSGAELYKELEDYERAFKCFDNGIKSCKDSKDKEKYARLAHDTAMSINDYNRAKNYLEQLTSLEEHKEVYLGNIDKAEQLEKLNQELKEKNKQLLEKEKELEDMMSMFAHKFRSPLDAIIYNTTHGEDKKLYAESANTMRGLLDIFSIISADDKTLTDKIKNDNKGNANLMTVFNKNLNMTLLHLLSVSGMSKIHQHYMNYAKAQGKITDDVSYKEWCDDYFEMEGALQKQWEQEFSALLNQSASLAERLQWLEHYFFKLDIIGFEINTIQFKEYETTESFLFILMNEILVNAFKYYASENKQPVVLEWTATENYQILSCRNPSIRRERDQHKGSGKGHTFLSALARKTGCKFTKPKPQDDFLLEFAIPNQLLLSNSGTEK